MDNDIHSLKTPRPPPHPPAKEPRHNSDIVLHHPDKKYEVGIHPMKSEISEEGHKTTKWVAIIVTICIIIMCFVILIVTVNQFLVPKKQEKKQSVTIATVLNDIGSTADGVVLASNNAIGLTTKEICLTNSGIWDNTTSKCIGCMPGFYGSTCSNPAYGPDAYIVGDLDDDVLSNPKVLIFSNSLKKTPYNTFDVQTIDSGSCYSQALKKGYAGYIHNSNGVCWGVKGIDIGQGATIPYDPDTPANLYMFEGKRPMFHNTIFMSFNSAFPKRLSYISEKYKDFYRIPENVSTYVGNSKYSPNLYLINDVPIELTLINKYTDEIISVQELSPVIGTNKYKIPVPLNTEISVSFKIIDSKIENV